MRSDQKVHGCILCLPLGSIDGDLHHLHIWSICGHRTHFRCRNGTSKKILLMIRNQVDLHYFYKPKIDVHVSFKLLDIGVSFSSDSFLVQSGKKFKEFLILEMCVQMDQVFTSLALFDILAGPLNNFPWVINGIIEV